MAPIKASRELIELEGTLYERYKPAGAATQFTLIELRNCPVAGNYPLKGEFGGAVPQSGASVNDPSPSRRRRARRSARC